jgi:hypothetical protein
MKKFRKAKKQGQRIDAVIELPPIVAECTAWLTQHGEATRFKIAFIVLLTLLTIICVSISMPMYAFVCCLFSGLRV